VFYTAKNYDTNQSLVLVQAGCPHGTDLLDMTLCDVTSLN